MENISSTGALKETFDTKALFKKIFCILITYNNPLKVCFSNNPNKSDTNCKSIFLIRNLAFNGFLKIIGVEN